jgi:hypothetical protein
MPPPGVAPPRPVHVHESAQRTRRARWPGRGTPPALSVSELLSMSVWRSVRDRDRDRQWQGPGQGPTQGLGQGQGQGQLWRGAPCPPSSCWRRAARAVGAFEPPCPCLYKILCYVCVCLSVCESESVSVSVSLGSTGAATQCESRVCVRVCVCVYIYIYMGSCVHACVQTAVRLR